MKEEFRDYLEKARDEADELRHCLWCANDEISHEWLTDAIDTINEIYDRIEEALSE